MSTNTDRPDRQPAGTTSAAGSFPFLSSELDQRECIDSLALVCWDRALRDCLYAAGLERAAPSLARPLTFSITLSRWGVPSLILGSLHPLWQSQAGLQAGWRRAVEGQAGLTLIQSVLLRGQAVPIVPNLSRMPHSRWFGQIWTDPKHAVIVSDLDIAAQNVTLHDDYARSGANFEDGRGIIGVDELLAGLHNAWVCDWRLDARIEDPQVYLRRIVELSCLGLADRTDGHRGIGAIASLVGVLRGMSSHPARASYVLERVGRPLGYVEGTRTLLARALAQEGPEVQPCERAVELLTVAAARWRSLRRSVALYSGASGQDLPHSVERAVDRVQEAERESLQALRSLARELNRTSL